MRICCRLKYVNDLLHQNSGEKVDKCGRPVVYIFAAKHNKNERDLNEIKKMIIYTLEQVLPPLSIYHNL